MSQAAKIRTRYPFHRAALAPLLPGATPAVLKQACAEALELGETAFRDFLHQQGLAPMWDELLAQQGHGEDPLSEEFKESLHQARLHATGLYLVQHHRLSEIRGILDDEGIAHVVYKGADTRERYFVEPALRPATDIDLLVDDSNKVRAIQALQRAGFEFHATEDNISHEANLNRGKISIDLHWDIMRPGRTRISIVGELLEGRRDCGSHWGMSDEANLFVMLVHPVFTKYSTAPQAALVRMVDLINLLARGGIDWDQLFALLDKAGLRTAAWITLRWLRLLTGTPLADDALGILQPGKLRRKYMEYWIDGNLATRWQAKPIYVQLGLTLPAHDRWRDAMHAVRQARKLRHSQHDDLQNLLADIATQP